MLVLAIAVSLVLFGIRIYNQFAFQANEQKIVGNVNQLFQALEGYYYANCRQTLDASSNPQSTGALDPINTDASAIPSAIALSIATDLVTPGFIPSADWHLSIATR